MDHAGKDSNPWHDLANPTTGVKISWKRSWMRIHSLLKQMSFKRHKKIKDTVQLAFKYTHEEDIAHLKVEVYICVYMHRNHHKSSLTTEPRKTKY